MQARYVILRVLLEGAGDLVSLEQTTGSNGKPNIVVKLDRTKIETLGKKAIGDFLHKLQVNNMIPSPTSQEGKIPSDIFSIVVQGLIHGGGLMASQLFFLCKLV